MPAGRPRKLGKKSKYPTALQRRENFINNLRNMKQVFKTLINQKRKYIWGLDISLSNTAITIYNINTGEFFCRSHKMSGGLLERYKRLRLLEKEMEKLVNQFPPLFTIFEGYAYGARQSREILGEATYAVKRALCIATVPSLAAPPQSLKKFIMLKGGSWDKPLILARVRKIWFEQAENHDEADSFGACMLAVLVFKFVIQQSKDYEKWDDTHIRKLFKNPLGKVKLPRWQVIMNIITDDGENLSRFL